MLTKAEKYFIITFVVRTGHCCDHAGGKGADQRYRKSNSSGKGDRAILSEKLYARTEKEGYRKTSGKLGTPAWRAGAIISLLVIAASWYNIGVSQNVA